MNTSYKASLYPSYRKSLVSLAFWYFYLGIILVGVCVGVSRRDSETVNLKINRPPIEALTDAKFQEKLQQFLSDST